MKKLSMLLMLLAFSSVSLVEAQGTDKSSKGEKIVVDVSDLTPEQLEQIKAKQKLEKTAETVNTVAGVAKDARSIGHEIGVAVDEALGAVTKHAEAFGKTDVGRFTMAMVFLAIMKDQLPIFYEQILGTVFGVPFIFFINVLFFVLYLKTTKQYRRIKGYDANKKPEYEYIDTWFLNLKADNQMIATILYGVLVLISNIWVIAGVIF